MDLSSDEDASPHGRAAKKMKLAGRKSTSSAKAKNKKKNDIRRGSNTSRVHGSQTWSWNQTHLRAKPTPPEGCLAAPNLKPRACGDFFKKWQYLTSVFKSKYLTSVLKSNI